MHAAERGEKLVFDLVVGHLKYDVARRRVFRQIDERLAPELSAIDKRTHLDDRSERHPAIRDVRYVIRRELVIGEERRAHDALVLHLAQTFAFALRQLRTETGGQWRGERDDRAVEAVHAVFGNNRDAVA